MSSLADGCWYYYMFLTFRSQLTLGYVKVDFGRFKSILIKCNVSFYVMPLLWSKILKISITALALNRETVNFLTHLIPWSLYLFNMS